MGEVTLVTPESGVPAVTLSRCHATVTREDCAFRTQSLCLQSSCTYFTPQTHRIVFDSYLFLRAIQKLGLKIYSMSTRWSRPRTPHLPVPVRHSSADSLSSGSRWVWDSSSSNIIKLPTSLSKENRRDRQWGFLVSNHVIFDTDTLHWYSENLNFRLW